MALRQFFEARAQALAIPFTHATETGELSAQVRAREAREMGTLQTPGCFGQMWEGPFGPDCAGCAAQAICLHEFVLREMPHAVRELQTNDPVALGERLQVDPRAIELAWQYVEGSAPSPRQKPPAAKSAPPKKTPPPPTKSLEKPTTPPPPSALPSPTGSAATAKAPASPPVAAPATPAPAPGGPSPSTSPTSSLPPPPTPTKAPTPSTKAASSPAPTKRPRTTKTPPTTTTAAAARPTPAEKIKSPPRSRKDPGFVPWGRHTHEARFARERQRSELLATLRPGQTIRRTYKGQEVEVKVGEGCYLYQGVQYATLYQIVKEVTGPKDYPRAGGKTRQITNWSATRFFGPAVEELLTCW